MTSTASANRPTVPLLMLLGGLFLFSIQDVLISDLTKRYPVHEIVFVRSLVNIWPLILLSFAFDQGKNCLLYTSPSPRDVEESRMPSSA